MGYYSGAEEHFTHEKEGVGATYYDLSRNAGETISPARSLVGDNGTYSSYIYGLWRKMERGCAASKLALYGANMM